MRQINAAGLALLKSFEKCVLTAYKDQGGVWTVGYGHTGPEVTEGLQWTKEQAEYQLDVDLNRFYQIDHYVSENVNDNQYSALICLCFNVGLKAVKLSKTLRLINEGESPDQEWKGFNKVNGVISQGLINRRKYELKLFHTLGD